MKKKREPFLIRNISFTFHNQPLRHFSLMSLSLHYRLFNISIEPLPPKCRLIQSKQRPYNNGQSMQSTALPAPARLMCRKNFPPVRRRFLLLHRVEGGDESHPSNQMRSFCFNVAFSNRSVRKKRK